MYIKQSESIKVSNNLINNSVAYMYGGGVFIS